MASRFGIKLRRLAMAALCAQLALHVPGLAQDASLPVATAAPADASLATLETGLAQIVDALAASRLRAAELAAEDARRAERVPKLPAEQETARTRLESLPADRPLPETATEEELAAQLAAREERAGLEAKIAELQAEEERYVSEAELRAALRRAAAAEVARLEAQQSSWQIATDAQRGAEAELDRARAAARAAALANDPALAELAAGNAGLAELRSGKQGPGALIPAADAYASRIAALRARVREERLGALRRIHLLEEAGLEVDPKTGSLLRAQRAKLPDSADLRTELEENLRASAEGQLRQIDIEERAAALPADPAARVREIVASATEPKPDPAMVRTLLEERAELIGSLVTDYRTYNQSLAAANEDAKNALSEVASFARELDERLLWIPSAKPLTIGDFAGEIEASSKLLAGTPARQWLNMLGRDLRASPGPWIACALLLVLLIVRRPHHAQQLVACGELAARRNCSSFRPTAHAMVHSALLASPLPVLIGFLAWRGELPPPFGIGLRNVAIFVLLTGIAAALSRPRGLLEAHFRFGHERTALIHHNLRWFVPTMAPALFLSSALPAINAGAGAGRLVFILSMVLLVVLYHRLLHPKRLLISSKGKPGSLAKLVYGVSIVLAVALGIAAALGYFASAQTLRLQVGASMWLLLITLALAGLCLRWILVSRRRLAIDQALQRRAAAALEKQEGPERPQALPSLDEVKAQAVDVVAVEEQTRRLVRVAVVFALAFGLYGIWAQTLPALSILDRVTLWSTSAPAVEESPKSSTGALGVDLTPSGDQSAAQDPDARTEVIRPARGRVSLQDLLIAIVLLVLTWVAARNVPGLLELTILRRLNLKPGASFAFTTSIAYLIVVIGLLIAFGNIGVTWSKVQWIAAAITLGVGFGLQEVIANFVAGIILLFERPMRIGDIVTVGSVSGKVTQINIRATTIQQFNRRELIVPNKEFITGQLVNWTLSDSVLRFEIPVGIAYGSDTTQARDLLLKLANEHPMVLDEPEPGVVFGAFADSALSFELRGHVASPDHLLSTKNDLHYAIDSAFREAGIEISFPQMDVHVREMPGQKGPRGEDGAQDGSSS